MALGWNDVQRIKRVEARANALGFEFTCSNHNWGSTDTSILVTPKDDLLPIYSRTATFFTGSIEHIESWLDGIEWARHYDDLLKVSNVKKRIKQEDLVRQQHLMKTLKTGKLVTGKILDASGTPDEVVYYADDGGSGAGYQLTIWSIDSIITTMKNTKKIKMNIRRHQALFNKDLPFKAKVERDRTKYTRKRKHRNAD